MIDRPGFEWNWRSVVGVLTGMMGGPSVILIVILFEKVDRPSGD